jgi:predicted nucleic acid-binding protein
LGDPSGDRAPTRIKAQADLFAWLSEGLIERFGQRILPLEIKTTTIWGSLVARMEQAGHIMPVMDSLIAADAQRTNLC